MALGRTEVTIEQVPIFVRIGRGHLEPSNRRKICVLCVESFGLVKVATSPSPWLWGALLYLDTVL